MSKILGLISKIGIVVCATLLALMITVTVITGENFNIISSTLGHKTYELIETDENVDPDTLEYYKSEFGSIKELKAASAAHCETVEAEGAVLLLNKNNALPLGGDELDVSLFSITSVDPVYGGTGSGAGGAAEDKRSFKDAFEGAGFSLNNDLYSYYQTTLDSGTAANNTYRRQAMSVNYNTGLVSGGRIGDVPWDTVLAANESTFASYGDAAIFIIARNGGEGMDMPMSGFNTSVLHGSPDSTDGDYLQLSPKEKGILAGLKAQKDANVFKKIIVLLNSANQVQLDYLNDPAYGIDACVWIGSMGSTGIMAVPKILKGDINPSGRLSDTFWVDHMKNPVHTNFGDYWYTNIDEFEFPYGDFTGQTPGGQDESYWVYQEGIYVGYKYTETRYEDYVTQRTSAGTFGYREVVAYPFGYGDSYTDFKYSNIRVNKEAGQGTYEGEDVYKVRVDVENTGAKAGKEAVQIYLQKPYTQSNVTNKVEKAAVEMLGFDKTDILQPGGKETVEIFVREQYLASYDANQAKTFVVDEGKYYFTAGKDAHDAVNNILAKKGHTPANTNNRMDTAGNADIVYEFERSKDAVTFAKSTQTDNDITNLFDFSDINRYSGRGSNSVTYFTRNDWAGTLVLPNEARDNYVKLSMTKDMYDTYMSTRFNKNIPTDDKTAYPKYGVDNGLKLIDMRIDKEGKKIPFDDLAWNDFLDQLTWDETASLLSTGLRKTAAIERLGKPQTTDHNGPVGVTQPYSSDVKGLATRLNDPDKAQSPIIYPCGGLRAATFNPDVIERVGELIGEDSLWAGHAGLYGFGNNMHRSHYGGRSFEYYSEDGYLTGMICGYESKGLWSRGCYVYNKHFVLNDQETNRGGCSMWLTEQSLREIYLRAYDIPIWLGDAMNVMTTFTRMGSETAAGCRVLNEDWLRGEAGMRGFVVTDMYSAVSDQLTMAHCIWNGNDLPDGDIDAKAHFSQFEKGGYGELAQRMRLSAKRILYTVVHSNGMNGMSSTTIINRIMPAWQVAVVTADIILGVLAIGFVAVYIVCWLKGRKA